MDMQRRRCQGLLMGVVAGDRNGGPLRMAQIIARRVLAEMTSSSSGGGRSTSSSPNLTHLEGCLARDYLHWFESGRAFDYGTAFGAVYRRLSAKLKRKETPPQEADEGDVRDGDDGSSTDRRFLLELKTIVGIVADEIDSAGVNPAHRNAVLAMFHKLFETDAALAEAARLDTRLTHLHPAAVDTAVAVVVICRRLIQGQALDEAIAGAIPQVRDEAVLHALRQSSGGDDDARREEEGALSRGGFSPLTLRAALYFVRTRNSFAEALEASIRFAGPENYCPVLVGSIAGALYGDTAIPPAAFKNHPHASTELVDEICCLAADIARLNFDDHQSS